MSGKGPIRIPAHRKAAAGDAAIRAPWFAAPRLGQRPAILTFVGTDESFVDAFFRGVTRSGAGFTEDAFPRLLPARDFSEPPRELMDGAGAPSYVRAHVEPLEGERPSPGELALEGKATLMEALVDAGVGSTAALVEDKVYPEVGDASRAGWLRKLYLPMHCHFHMVACDLVCDRPGSPRIDEKRVIEAGMVIRRFLPDASAARPRWEDWIPSPRGAGIWAEIAREDMTLLSGARTVDPSAIARGDLGAKDVEIFDRLGLDDAPDTVLALSVARLAGLPKTLEPARTRTSRYGFLPLAMGDKERESREPSDDPEKIKTAFAAVAKEHLKARLTDHAAAIRARVRDALFPLLVRLRDTLPPRPLPIEVWGAQALIGWVMGASVASIDDGSRKLGLAVLARYANAALSPAAPTDRWAAAWKRTADIITNGASKTPEEIPPAGLPAWALTVAASASYDWVVHVLTREAMWRVFTDLFPSPATFVEDVEPGVLLALLLWVRRVRVGLLGAFYQVAFDEAGLEPPDPDLFVPHPETLVFSAAQALPLRVPMTTGALGAELSAWLSTNALRHRDPVEWRAPTPADGLTADGIALHDLAKKLEEALADVDAQGAGAGGAYAAHVRELADAQTGTLLGKIGGVSLEAQGIDVAALPESGLFVFPTPAVSAASMATFAAAVEGRYSDPAKETNDELRAAGEARRQMVLPRFDADHLYAVWCYAKVASRDPCELPQLVWSQRTEVFSLAEPMDLLGLKPVSIRLPDIPKMLRDMPRMKAARALPFAAIATPQGSGVKTGDDPKQTQREWGIAWICSFGIPVFTICAWIAFKIIFSILLILPGFAWMLLLKFCIPVPAPRRS